MEQSEDLPLTASDLVDAVYKHWDKPKKLKDVALKVIDYQFQLASEIAGSEGAENSAFVEEYGQQYKKNISVARAKAKQLAGSSKSRLSYEFEALKGLLDLIRDRLKVITSGQVQAHQGEKNPPLSFELASPTNSGVDASGE